MTDARHAGSAAPVDQVCRVLHLVAHDTPRHRLELLESLLAGGGFFGAHDALLVGRRMPVMLPARVRSRPSVRLHEWIRQAPASGPSVIHAWSPVALAGAIWEVTDWLDQIEPAGGAFAETGAPGIVADVDFPANAPQIENALRGTPFRVVAITPTVRAWRQARAAGIDERDCAVVRDFVDFGALSAARQRADRATLGFPSDARVVLALPPFEREAAGAMLAWGALLLAHLHPQVHLVIGGDDNGNEVRRARELFGSCGRGEALRVDDRPLAELLTLADVAGYVPEHDASTAALPWAMAAGVPIVASATPCVTEWLAHGESAYLARPGAPKPIARRLLEALTEPRAREMAREASRQAFKLFGRQRAVEQRGQVYANVVAGRPASDGLEAIAGA